MTHLEVQHCGSYSANLPMSRGVEPAKQAMLPLVQGALQAWGMSDKAKLLC